MESRHLPDINSGSFLSAEPTWSIKLGLQSLRKTEVNYRQPLICKLLGGMLLAIHPWWGKSSPLPAVICQRSHGEPTVGTFKMTSSAARARSASCVAKDCLDWTDFSRSTFQNKVIEWILNIEYDSIWFHASPLQYIIIYPVQKMGWRWLTCRGRWSAEVSSLTPRAMEKPCHFGGCPLWCQRSCLSWCKELQRLGLTVDIAWDCCSQWNKNGFDGFGFGFRQVSETKQNLLVLCLAGGFHLVAIDHFSVLSPLLHQLGLIPGLTPSWVKTKWFSWELREYTRIIWELLTGN